MTMISESEPSRLRTWPADTISAIGAMIMTRSGTIIPVMPTKTKSVCRSLVIRSKSRIAWVNQITTVKVISVIRNATIVVRNMYRLIDPIGSRLPAAGAITTADRRTRRMAAQGRPHHASGVMLSQNGLAKAIPLPQIVQDRPCTAGAAAVGKSSCSRDKRTLHDRAVRFISRLANRYDPAGRPHRTENARCPEARLYSLRPHARSSRCVLRRESEIRPCDQKGACARSNSSCGARRRRTALPARTDRPSISWRRRVSICRGWWSSGPARRASSNHGTSSSSAASPWERCRRPPAEATIFAEFGSGALKPDQVADLALGVRLRAYSFDRYKTKRKEGEERADKVEVDLACANPAAAEKAWGAHCGDRRRRRAGARPHQ